MCVGGGGRVIHQTLLPQTALNETRSTLFVAAKFGADSTSTMTSSEWITVDHAFVNLETLQTPN